MFPQIVIGRINLMIKFDELISQVNWTVDVLMISETKIDDSFPIANFLIDALFNLIG